MSEVKFRRSLSESASKNAATLQWMVVSTSNLLEFIVVGEKHVTLYLLCQLDVTFSALVGWQEGHLACKN